MSRRRQGAAGGPGLIVPYPDPRYSNGFRYRARYKIPGAKLAGNTSLAALPLLARFQHPWLRFADPLSEALAGKITNFNVWDIRFENLTGTRLPHRVVSHDNLNGILVVEFLPSGLTGGTASNGYLYIGKPEVTSNEEQEALIAAPFTSYYDGWLEEVGNRASFNLAYTDNATPGTGNKSGKAWKSGVAPTALGQLSEIKSFEAFRNNRIADVVSLTMPWDVFGPSFSNWVGNPFTKRRGYAHLLHNAGYIVNLGIPGGINSQDKSFTAMAANLANTGSTDYLTHLGLAQEIASWLGNDLIYLRLGYAANHNYPWSMYYQGDATGGNLADYATYYARMAQIYKGVLPGAKVVWNLFVEQNGTIKPGLYWPNDAIAGSVDVVGVTMQDTNGRYNTLTRWNTRYGTYNSGTGLFEGPGGHLAFALAKGVKLAFDHWGPKNTTFNFETAPTPAADGSNNNFYIQKMHDFFTTNVATLEYEVVDNSTGATRLDPAVAWLNTARTQYQTSWV